MPVVDPEHSKSKGRLDPERWAVVTNRVNVLIQGSNPFISGMLAALRMELPQREFIWPDRPIGVNTPAATVLVQEIAELSPGALDALANLIADTTGLQVIATSSVVLYELVECGQFPADLYYRLNVVMLTDDGGAWSGQAPCS